MKGEVTSTEERRVVVETSCGALLKKLAAAVRYFIRGLEATGCVPSGDSPSSDPNAW